jgi:Retrotransposon gag protein/Zinc knuckle
MTTNSRPLSPTGTLTRQFASLNLSRDSMSTKGEPPSARATRDEEDIDTSRDGVKVDFYYGDRSKLRAYLTQLKTAFAVRPAKYKKEHMKVLWASSYLRGDAYAWFEPQLTDYLDGEPHEPQTAEIFADFDVYEEELRQVFGTFDEERAAARQIHQLKQVGSATQYHSKFRQICFKLGWDDDAKASAFYTGLSNAVKERMMPTPPTELKELVKTAIDIDNRLYELRMERKGVYERRGNYNGYQRKGGYGDPMDLSIMHGGASRSKPPNRFNKGPRADNREKEKRRRENLCYSCGKSGHRARDCDSQPQKLHMMNDITIGAPAGIEETKADTSMKSREISDPGTAQKESEETQGTTPGDGYPNQQKELLETSPPHRCTSWIDCYDNSCTIHRLHKESSGWFPQDPRRSYERIRDQESLPMMNAPKEVQTSEEEEAEQSDESDQSWDSKDWYPQPTTVLEIDKDHITIKTRF